MDKLKMKKLLLENKTRYWCIAAAALIIITGGYLFYQTIRNQEGEKEYALYECTVAAEGSYTMELKENSLYPEGVLGEGRLYTKNLARSLHINLQADFTGSASAQITKNCQVDAVVQGYQENDEGRNIIYEEVRKISELAPTQSIGESAQMAQEVQIELGPYEEYAQMAAKTLGTNPMCELQIRFEGTFAAKTDYGNVEKPFSYLITMPLEAELFTVTKQDPISEAEQITETKGIVLPRNPLPAVLAGGLVLVGGAGVLLLLFCTAIPDQETKNKRYFAKIYRKYKSRIVQVKSVADISVANIRNAEVADVHSLVKLSDEIQRPICCSLDENGMPLDGMLYVMDEKVRYTLFLF